MFSLLTNRRKLRSNRELLGRWGEKRCEKFLRKKGLRTLTRNFRCNTGEIDLVMVDTDSRIVFVEVKTRTSEDFTDIENVITDAKKKRMARAAKYFISKYNIDNRAYCFDVVTILLGKKGKEQIKHYQNAFVSEQ